MSNGTYSPTDKPMKLMSHRIGCSYGHKIKQACGPGYVAHLEKQVEELQNQMRETCSGTFSSSTALATMSLSAPASAGSESLPSTTESGETSSQASTGSASAISSEAFPVDSAISMFAFDSPVLGFPSSGAAPGELLDTIPSGAEAQYQSEQDNTPTAFHGSCSGFSVLQRVHVLGSQLARYATDNHNASATKLVKALDQAMPRHYLTDNGMTNTFLPPKADLLRWVDIAFSDAFYLWPFVDRTQLESDVERVFHTHTFGRQGSDRDRLALMYAVLAHGQQCDRQNIEDVQNATPQRPRG